ncbi:MAG: hypothetical protein Q8S73_33185 [Deltaproteobacteria bacterium]|nr:hypothetical protein [Deltaproteobacteria bacterium]
MIALAEAELANRFGMDPLVTLGEALDETDGPVSFPVRRYVNGEWRDVGRIEVGPSESVNWVSAVANEVATPVAVPSSSVQALSSHRRLRSAEAILDTHDVGLVELEVASRYVWTALATLEDMEEPASADLRNGLLQRLRSCTFERFRAILETDTVRSPVDELLHSYRGQSLTSRDFRLVFLDLVGRMYRSSTVGISVWLLERERVISWDSHGITTDADNVARFVLQLEEGVTGRVAAAAGPFVIGEDLRRSSFFLARDFAEANGYEALVSVPIWCTLSSEAPTVAGVLNIYYTTPLSDGAVHEGARSSQARLNGLADEVDVGQRSPSRKEALTLAAELSAALTHGWERLSSEFQRQIEDQIHGLILSSSSVSPQQVVDLVAERFCAYGASLYAWDARFQRLIAVGDRQKGVEPSLDELSLHRQRFEASYALDEGVTGHVWKQTIHLPNAFDRTDPLVTKVNPVFRRIKKAELDAWLQGGYWLSVLGVPVWKHLPVQDSDETSHLLGVLKFFRITRPARAGVESVMHPSEVVALEGIARNCAASLATMVETRLASAPQPIECTALLSARVRSIGDGGDLTMPILNARWVDRRALRVIESLLGYLARELGAECAYFGIEKGARMYTILYSPRRPTVSEQERLPRRWLRDVAVRYFKRIGLPGGLQELGDIPEATWKRTLGDMHLHIEPAHHLSGLNGFVGIESSKNFRRDDESVRALIGDMSRRCVAAWSEVESFNRTSSALRYQQYLGGRLRELPHHGLEAWARAAAGVYRVGGPGEFILRPGRFTADQLAYLYAKDLHEDFAREERVDILGPILRGLVQSRVISVGTGAGEFSENFGLLLSDPALAPFPVRRVVHSVVSLAMGWPTGTGMVINVTLHPKAGPPSDVAREGDSYLHHRDHAFGIENLPYLTVVASAPGEDHERDWQQACELVREKLCADTSQFVVKETARSLSVLVHRASVSVSPEGEPDLAEVG